jgi:hypothetical protein
VALRSRQAEARRDILAVKFQEGANTWLKLAGLEQDEGNDSLRERAFSLAPTYLMLAGYAIEDLAKGLIVAHDGRNVSTRRISPGPRRLCFIIEPPSRDSAGTQPRSLPAVRASRELRIGCSHLACKGGKGAKT